MIVVRADGGASDPLGDGQSNQGRYGDDDANQIKTVDNMTHAELLWEGDNLDEDPSKTRAGPRVILPTNCYQTNIGFLVSGSLRKWAMKMCRIG
jgi:hypothetical protein